MKKNWPILTSIALLLLLTLGAEVALGKHKRNSRHRKAKEPAESVPGAPTSHDSRPQEGEEDVCSGWWCGHGRECRRGSDGIPECICQQECREDSLKSTLTIRGGQESPSGFGFPFDFKFGGAGDDLDSGGGGPICGSDGLVYPSGCELYRTACLTNSLLFVDTSPNACRRGRMPKPLETDDDGAGGNRDFGGKDTGGAEKPGRGRRPPPPTKPSKSDEEDEDDSLDEDDEEDYQDIIGDEDSSEEEQGRLKTFREELSRKSGPSRVGISKSGKSGSSSVTPRIRKKTMTTTTTDSSSTSNPGKIKRGSSLCSPQEYEILKDAILIYNQEDLVGKKTFGIGKGHLKAGGKEEDEDYDHLTLNGLNLGGEGQSEGKVQRAYLLSLMFAHFDRNHNGALDYGELQQIGFEEKLGRSILYCHPVDFLRFDDTDHDSQLSLNEFYLAFNKHKRVGVVDGEKGRGVIHLTATVGETIEMNCNLDLSNADDEGRSAVVWSRYGIDLSNLIKREEDKLSLHSGGRRLVINGVDLLHAGNYSCHPMGNKKLNQPFALSVQTPPDVKVRPHMVVWQQPGQEVDMECRARGEPLPTVHWLKNDSPLPAASSGNNNKYDITGDGITLRVKDINFSDTGAYMCQAQNSVGKRIDIASLVVIDEQTLPPVQTNETEFLVFHDKGISAYDPTNCRIQHQILSTDVIPGTQRDYICGSSSCEWGRAIRVSSVYVYVSQPKLHRILVISISQMVVVDVVLTDPYPVELHYVPQVDQIWLECWRGGDEESPDSGKTLQVIRNAKEKRKHRAIHPKGFDKPSDIITNVFLPPDLVSSSQFLYAYVAHKDTRGLYKVDLRTLRYVKSVDLTAYNCLPQRVHFSALYGFIILECKEPVLQTPTGQLVLDALSDGVVGYQPLFNGQSTLSPDSRELVTWVHHPDGTSVILQLVKENGLEFSFDVKTSLNISHIAFFPSQRFHTYDLFATSKDKEDVLFLELQSGQVELVPGVGRSPEYRSWKRPQRPIESQDVFGKYLVTPSTDAVFVLNGRDRTVNCEIGGIPRPSVITWL